MGFKLMCKSIENPIPVKVWTLDGRLFLGEGKIMGTATSHYAMLNGRMITPMEWGADFDSSLRANLTDAGATLVTVPDDQVILANNCVLFGSQVSWKEITAELASQ
jgi:hypothetical protein